MVPNLAMYETALRRLKAEGCAVLVTGNVPSRALRATTRTLFGAPDEPRRRVLALADPAAGEPADLLPADAHPADDRVRVLDFRDLARAADEAHLDGSPFAAPGADDVDAVHLETSRALADVTPADPDPAELRLSVASLPVLLDHYDRESVEQFVRATAAQVRGLDGMAHYLLPVVDDAGWVDLLDPLFDARIELRTAVDGPPEHRWHLPSPAHLPESERTSDWHDLPVTDDRGWGKL